MSSLRGGVFTGLHYLVITMHTDVGLSASMFGFASRSALGAAHLAADAVAPFFIGRDPFLSEKNWHEFRTADRWWGHLPIYSYGPFDVCTWLLRAQAAGQPLYRYLGAAHDEVPAYVSSMVLDKPEDYAAEALVARDAGFKAYKLHTPGKEWSEDMLAHELCREVIGEDQSFKLMSDPVACFNLEQAVKFGRRLEQLDYEWLEEPLADEYTSQLRELTRILDIPIVGTEVIAKHPYSVAECISTRVVDRVRACVSWSGGVTGALKTARLAESFGVNCELHTTIFHPLDLANLHVAAAVHNNTYFELLCPVDMFAFGLKEPINIIGGMAQLPQKPGLGIELDWDEIDACTLQVLEVK